MQLTRNDIPMSYLTPRCSGSSIPSSIVHNTKNCWRLVPYSILDGHCMYILHYSLHLCYYYELDAAALEAATHLTHSMPQCSFSPVASFFTYSCFQSGTPLLCGDPSSCWCFGGILLFVPSGFRHPHFRHIEHISQCHTPGKEKH